MASGTTIISVTARQVFSDRGTRGGGDGQDGERRGKVGHLYGRDLGGQHEVEFTYDGGPKWRGKGVQRAVDHVNRLDRPGAEGHGRGAGSRGR